MLNKVGKIFLVLITALKNQIPSINIKVQKKKNFGNVGDAVCDINFITDLS